MLLLETALVTFTIWNSAITNGLPTRVEGEMELKRVMFPHQSITQVKSERNLSPISSYVPNFLHRRASEGVSTSAMSNYDAVRRRISASQTIVLDDQMDRFRDIINNDSPSHEKIVAGADLIRKLRVSNADSVMDQRWRMIDNLKEEYGLVKTTNIIRTTFSGKQVLEHLENFETLLDDKLPKSFVAASRPNVSGPGSDARNVKDPWYREYSTGQIIVAGRSIKTLVGEHRLVGQDTDLLDADQVEMMKTIEASALKIGNEACSNTISTGLHYSINPSVMLDRLHTIHSFRSKISTEYGLHIETMYIPDV